MQKRKYINSSVLLLFKKCSVFLCTCIFIWVFCIIQLLEQITIKVWTRITYRTKHYRAFRLV